MKSLLSAQIEIECRRFAELVAWQCGLGISLVVPLILGQLLRLRSIIWPLSTESLNALLSLVSGGSLILLEVALPLATLGAVIIGVRRWRSNGEYEDFWTLGGSPFVFIRPIIILALINTLIGLFMSGQVTPKTLRTLKSNAIELSQHQWRGIIPSIAAHLDLRIHSMTSENGNPINKRSIEYKKKNHSSVQWLIQSQLSSDIYPGFTFIKCDLIQRESICLSTWWTGSDEQSKQLTLHDVSYTSELIQLKLGHFDIHLPDLKRSRLYETFGPPNSLDNSQLNQSVHHRFIYHKRLALPLLNLLLALIGTWAGLSLGLGSCALIAVSALSCGLGLLRALELWARMGSFSPLIAAWSPTLILILTTTWMLKDLLRRAPQPT